MGSTKTVFFLGATGYIGGSVLKALLTAFPFLSVTALVRSSSAIEPVRAIGVHNVIQGSHDDLDKIKSLASEADIVMNCADADDLPLTMAILSGLRERANKGSKGILLHTSGTGVVSDTAEGEFVPSAHKIWNDNSEEDIKSIPPEQPHRLIDLEIFRANEYGHCDAYIIAPSCIYGTGIGPINRLSQQIPGAIKIALKRNQAVYVGKGTNKWNNVHILDLVDLYKLVLKHALSGVDKSSSYGRFYFASPQEHVWGDIIRQIGLILHERGIIPTSEAASVSLKEEPRMRYVANNSRSSSDRGFALGWRPKAPSLEETLEEDVVKTVEKLKASGQ